MWTLLLAYLGGVLTIFSPCVLPVVPFVFSRSDEPFRKSGLPMLAGMGLSFALFAALSVVGGRWVIQANQIGRTVALVVFAFLGLTLLFSSLAEKFTAPLVRLGGVLQKRADASGRGLGASLLLGASVGLLWAPCAGPILGLVLAGAALGDSGQKTFGLLLVFAAGAGTSLAVAILASGRVLRTLKRGLGAEEWIKRALGVMVLAAVAAIALGLDTRLLARLSFLNTSRLEQALIDRSGGVQLAAEKREPLADQGPAPGFAGATDWINSKPLTLESLRGKVVLVDFWTYSCINCLRTLPYLKAWQERYASQGLVIIGVHTPEFAFEKIPENVRKAVVDLGLKYPIAIDNDQKIWTAYQNRYWPAHYFIDARGRIRHAHFGEGEYAESEKVIQALLSEASGGKVIAPKVALAPIGASGVEAAPATLEAKSAETYLGYDRQEGFASKPSIAEDRVQSYAAPGQGLALDQWGLAGAWKVSDEMSALASGTGSVVFRFQARDLHLVIGNPSGKAIPFRVTVDGQAPGAGHGLDTDAEGRGHVREHRLYQLIRFPEPPRELHTFEIRFLGPGAEVYAFTFG